MLAGTALASTSLPVRQSAFAPAAGSLPAGWRTWSARLETAPRVFVDTAHSLGEPGSLAISGNGNAPAFGGWEFPAAGVEGGRWYRLTAHYRAEGVRDEALQILARLDWMDAAGKRSGQPDYAYRTEPRGAWRKVTLDAPAPEKAAGVVIQLYLQNAPQATVWWDDIALDPIPAPAPRPVTVASIHLKPANTGSAAESVRQFLAAIERTVPGRTDVILLPEGITVVGTGKSYAEVAEPVPGPTTARLAQVARSRRSYVAAGIYEREGSTIYNTAVLLDRAGQLAGKYRKVYLPREEIEGGLTPGIDYPVFQTDFGTVGMMICWDAQYADPARALALRGAELILLPIWGGNQTLGKARAIENRVFIAASGYNYPTYVMDPDGELLAVAREPGAAAIATIDLSRRYTDPGLGDLRGRFRKELRWDVPVRPAGLAP
jgi:predicted amidohydrolase